MSPLKKDYEDEVREGENYDAVLGVDVGAKRLVAVSIINREGRILKQLYLGQDVGDRQRDIDLRRSKLRSYVEKGDRPREARQCLRRLRKYEEQLYHYEVLAGGSRDSRTRRKV